jgi:ABC-type lipoprotein release transport system permease subunit
LALASGDRFFRDALAHDLADPLDAALAAAVQISGTATRTDGTARANRVQVLGVDARFWGLAAAVPPFEALAPGEVALNEPLAAQLRVGPGESILVRVPKPSQLSRDAPLAPAEDAAAALRLTVRAVVTDLQFGRFGLQSSQVAPYNAFVSLAALQQQLQIPGRANLVLAGPGAQSTPFLAGRLLRRVWQLSDAELELREVPEASVLELRSRRVFLEPAVVAAGQAASGQAGGVLTYLVNELRVADRATPYSMVTAMGAPVVPADMGDDEILINDWLAKDLAAKVGDRLALSYYVVGLGRALEERHATFRVRGILPLQGPAADRSLMPDFPGLTDAANCRDWDTGFPVQTSRVREQDERYWDDYRGTPKAFITLAAGQRLWRNRFGSLTALRYPLASTTQAALGQAILRALNPESVGLRFEPARVQALTAAAQSQDLGGLFLGFSFFLVVAALLLMALLFQFGLEQRATEVGTMLALGYTPRQVRRLLGWEGGALALAGGVAGVLGGVAYAQGMLYGLATLWRDAVGTTALGYHAAPLTLALGAGAGVVVAWLTIGLTLRRQAERPARELLAQGSEADGTSPARGTKPGRREWVMAVVAAGGAASLLLTAALRGETSAGFFFGAGALLLAAGLAGAAWLLQAGQLSAVRARLSLTGLGLRNVTRRKRRSLATVGLIACGSFLIASIGVFRLEAVRGAEQRRSGTGGFALVGESALPVVQDLNTERGREFYALEPKKLAGVNVVPLRVREGDEASCLNLNRAQKPRLLGVQPELLAQRRAFTFAKVARGLPPENPWLLLKEPAVSAGAPAVIPAVGDQASIVWAMGKQVGDTLPYTDEQGRSFQIRLVGAVANSILQGNLLIDEEHFVRLFPSESGYRMFLIDAPFSQAEPVAEHLMRALRDVGLELVPAAQRLAAFNAVQNTYLSTFQVLGGLGLLLGSAGLGIVVLRNVLERRGELALLLTVGLRPRSIRWLVLSEHGVLLLAGLAVGVLSAWVAVLPAVLSPGAVLPYRSLALTLGAVLANGALWTAVATHAALGGPLLDALRNE